MTHRTPRYIVLGIATTLVLAVMTGCFFGGGEEPEPTATPDLAATIAAAVDDAVPTETPVPPTDTPVPPTPEPTPDLPATLAAMLAATEAARPTDTPVPTPTNTPEPTPTNTPVPPTNTPAPTPTNTPVPNPASQIPCIIAGVVRSGGSPAANRVVYARAQDGRIVAEDETGSDGVYSLSITEFDNVFDLYVGGTDSGMDSPITSPGCRVVRNLSIN